MPILCIAIRNSYTSKYFFNLIFFFVSFFRRRPSWTDRILYKVNPDTYEDLKLSVRQLSYNSFSQYKQSDHKPVIAEFIIKVSFIEHKQKVVYEMFLFNLLINL